MSSQKQVLLVEAEDAFRRELAAHMRLHEDLAVDEAASARQALDRLASRSYDALVIDVDLPDADGWHLCRLLRQRGLSVPIITLTSHPAKNEANLRPESGASASVAKPVHLRVLLARLRTLLRQFELSEELVFRIGPYRFRPAARMLLAPSGKKIRLTEKETAILKYLYRVGDRPVPRDVLLEKVWGYHAGVTTHTVETHIYRLRQKIEPAPGQSTVLVTEPGGYRLIRGEERPTST